MRAFLTFLFILINFGVNAQQDSSVYFVSASKQSSFSVRPEISLFSQMHVFGLKVGELIIHPKPGVAIGYSKRYWWHKSLGFELGIFGGITRFAYTATAPKENFSPRTYTFALEESLVNPYLSFPILLNFQHPLNNKLLFTLFGGANFKAHLMEEIGSGLSFSNATWKYSTGDVFDLDLVFRNKPVNTGIMIGAGIGKMLPNQNILQLNFWANIGLYNQVEGTYYFYDQQFDSSGSYVINYVAEAGTIESKGSCLGTELRYTFTGIRKRMNPIN